MGSISGIDYPVILTDSTGTRFFGVAKEGRWFAFSVRDNIIYQTQLAVTMEHLNTIKTMTGITLITGEGNKAYYDFLSIPSKDDIAAGVQTLP